MKRYLVVLFLLIGLANGFGTGCSSGDSASDDASVESDGGIGDEIAEEDVGDDTEFADTEDSGGDEEFMDEGDGDAEDTLADGGAEGGDDEFSDEEFTDEGGSDDQSVADGEDFGDDVATDDGEGGFESDDVSEDSTAEVGGEESLDSDSSIDDSSQVAEGSVDDSGMDSMASDTSTDMGFAPSFVPVKKIQPAPFTKNGSLMNTVYIARPGDDIFSISHKIFGDDRSSTLLDWNGHLRRGVKVGDKVYYNSSRRPMDNNRMLTYYEDIGLEAQHYFSKSGDNIRVVARQLLGSDGHERSWMEVWATNPDVESKGDLPEGIDLRYWPPGAAPTASPVVADTSLPADPMAPNPMAGGPTADPGMAITPEPMPNDPMAMAGGPDPMAGAADPGIPDIPDVPSTPAPDMNAPGAAMGAAATPGGSPPPNGAAAMAGDEDMTMTLALVGVVLLAAVGLMVIMKKNRARRMDLTQTQI